MTTQPTFLLGFHRGGTTFVQRILNCHRDVTIWGENAGLVSKLRLLHEAYASAPTMKVNREEYRDFSRFADKFIPWANPVAEQDVADLAAQFVESIYRPASMGVRYWGFKEIQHCHVQDIAFFCRLFPTCRILLLTRHPKDVLLSRFCVRWSRARTGINPEEFVRDVLGEYFQRLDAFLVSSRRWPANVRLVKYETACGDDRVPALFGALDIPSDGIDQRLLSVVVDTVAGSSFGDRGREVSDAERDRVSAIYDQVLPEIVTGVRLDGDRNAISAWYPA
jgi:hypothetical protein